MFFDADAHVDECADTWSYFPKSMSEFGPIEMTFARQPGYVERRDGPKTGLFIDGQLFGQFIRNDDETNSTLEIRRLMDVPGRLKRLDQLQIEYQVIYPTLLLSEITARPELEVAICESYNRWLGDRCKESQGRLQWNAVLPLRSMPDALREMRRVKEAGAVGIFKRSLECDERRIDDPYFHPIYELAQDLDLPICIHTGGPYRPIHNLLSKTHRPILSVSLIQDAFVAMVRGGVHERFPRLRVGFIEAASGWLPYALWLTSFEEGRGNRSQNELLREKSERTLREYNFFISCEASENLSDIVRQVGDNNLGVGTDYVHTDRATQLEAHREILERTDISSETAEKLTNTNAREFYGLA